LHECELREIARVKEFVGHENKGYHLRPYALKMCDPNGWYSSVQIDGEIQFCADKFGKQLEEFQLNRYSTAAANMNCHCAKMRDLLNGKNYAELPVCCPNGNFQKIACRRGYCYCVDDNGYQISQEVRENEMRSLNCYNNGVLC